jgi:phosphoribosylformylglycinamidine synthase
MSKRGIAISTDCNGRYCYLDPYRGAQIALVEGMRNLACVGAKPAAITDCLNFGDPDKPEVFYTFEQAVGGLSSACEYYGIPVVSGNVSFYNESMGDAIYPTPAIGIVGTVDDVSQVATCAFKQDGDAIILVGETYDEMGASESLKAVYGTVAGAPPALDLELEGNVQDAVIEAVQKGLLRSAHDCSEGGIAITLAECCMAGDLGANIVLDDGLPRVVSLFSESQSRIVISVSEHDVDAVLDILGAHDVPYSVIGTVGGNALVIDGCIDVSLERIQDIYDTALEDLVQGVSSGERASDRADA